MSVEIGKINTLRVAKLVEFGAYLDGGDRGEILLPKNSMPDYCTVDSHIEVFIYFDSESRIIATTRRPSAMVGEAACLKVVSTSSFGAFLDWGLPQKDLLVPFAEQKTPMKAEKFYCVFIYTDKHTGRIVASAKLDKFITVLNADFKEMQGVDLFITEETETGYKAIINNTHWGMLYKNEVFQKLNIGQKIKGLIKKIREDNKIDLSLYAAGYKKVEDILETILTSLKVHNGFIPLNDKTPPADIYAFFGVSKQSFKNAIGGLYKKKLIRIDPDGIRLIEK
jgi:predicted RNA-binding protein (virulence factor B family)